MCIICVSRSGVRQPGEAAIRAMFLNNPHGAGYMFARDGWVTIHKGFMDLGDYLRAIREEHFTVSDSVVYHFRISTQAGVSPEMTHPFPLSNRPRPPAQTRPALPRRRRAQRRHPPDQRPRQRALQRHRHLYHRLPLPHHPRARRPARPARAGQHLPNRAVQVRHHGRRRIHRHGREVHRRARAAVQQRQLPALADAVSKLPAHQAY